MLTPQEAIDGGLVIDRHTYPWVAYKGPRFNPSEFAHCLTDLEAELLASLRFVTEQLSAINSIYSLTEGDTKTTAYVEVSARAVIDKAERR